MSGLTPAQRLELLEGTLTDLAATVDGLVLVVNDLAAPPAEPESILDLELVEDAGDPRFDALCDVILDLCRAVVEPQASVRARLAKGVRERLAALRDPPSDEK